MRAPDGFYSVGLNIFMNLVSAGVLVYSLKKIRNRINSKEIILAGAIGAFCFALQIITLNVACGGKTCTCGCSFHFAGGVLASIALGPHLAAVIMTVVHLIQVFLFQEGGIIAFGSNFLLIVCISTFGGYYIYSLIKNLVIEPYGQYISAFFSVWFTSLVCSLAICGMLSISAIEPFSITCSMIGSFALYGIIEGLLTIFLIYGITLLSTDILQYEERSSESVKKVAYVLLCLDVVGCIFISPFTSPHKSTKLVLNRPHINSQKLIVPYRAPIPHYHLPQIKNHNASHILAGILGVATAFIACLFVSSMLKERLQTN